MSTAHRPLYVAEPPATYLHRPPLVIDCSVLAAFLFQEAQCDEACALLSGKTLHAPMLIEQEIASVALKKLRAGAARETLEIVLSQFAKQEIRYYRTDIAAQLRLAEQYRLTSYDAAYLWLAGSLRAPLASFDRQLAAAACDYLGGPPLSN